MSTQSELLQIDGWFGGGKSVLLGLLDAHPQISPNPVHDATHMAFLAGNHDTLLQARDLEKLRRILGTTQYYSFEKAAIKKYIQHFPSANTLVNVGYELDFYEFDKSWPRLLADPAYGEWSAEKIITTIYSQYAYFLTGKSDWKYHTTISWAFLDQQKRIHSTYPNMKSIFVRRPVMEIIATRATRKKLENMADSFFAPGFDRLMREGEVAKIIDYQNFWDAMAAKYPGKYKVVEFEELMTDTTAVMKGVADFLEVSFEPSMCTWTLMGKEFAADGKRFAEGINDRSMELLTAEQRNEVDRQIQKHLRKLRSPKRNTFLFHSVHKWALGGLNLAGRGIESVKWRLQ